MDLVFFLGRSLLTGVFALAAAAKLADRTGSRKAITDFGFPARWARLLGMLLPLAELSVAGLLIVPRSVLWGGFGALGLLTVFSVAIAVNLARGRTPDCHCFGQLHSKPIGWQTLVRNALLAALAGVVAWQERDGRGLSAVQAADEVVHNPYTGGALAASAVVFAFVAQGWLIFHLLRQHGRLLVRIDVLEAALQETGLLAADVLQTPQGLRVGAWAPPFELSTLSGGTTTLERLRESVNPVLLVFSNPECEPCIALLPQVARWEREEADRLTIALISGGTLEANREKIQGYGLNTVLLQRDREVAEAYHAHGTPSAVLVRRDGSVGSPLAIGPQAIARLVAQATGQGPENVEPFAATNGHLSPSQPQLPILTGVHVGQQAPSFRLFDLDGKAFELNRDGGRETLLLFWNPNCGFCSKMLPELRTWERDRPADTPDLLVISTGSVELNRAMALESPVLLDPRFSVGTSYGVRGTPSAVLVDSNGNIASETAVGAEAILALARCESTSWDRKSAVV